MSKHNKQEVINQITGISVDLQTLMANLKMLKNYVGFINELPEPKKRGRPIGTKNKPGHRAGRPPKTYTHVAAPSEQVKGSFYHIPKNLPAWLVAEPRENFAGSAERYSFKDTRTGGAISTYFDDSNALGFFKGPSYFEAYPIEDNPIRWIIEDEPEMYKAIIAEFNRIYAAKSPKVKHGGWFNPMIKGGNL